MVGGVVGQPATRRSGRLLFARGDGRRSCRRRVPPRRPMPLRSRASRSWRSGAGAHRRGAIVVVGTAGELVACAGSGSGSAGGGVRAAGLDERWRRTSLQRHHGGRVRGAQVGSEPEQERSPTSRRWHPRRSSALPSGTARPTPRCSRARSRWPRCRSGCRSARSCIACSRRRTSLPPISKPSSARASPRVRAGATSISAIRGPSARGWPPRSRRRSARCSAGSGCATSRARDRLDELDFELPLVGGDEPTGTADARRDRRRPARASSARRPAARLREATRGSRAAADLRGYLTGSIDLVVRLRGADERAALRDRRLQDELACAARRGADGMAPPPVGAGRARCSASPLRAAGAAVHGRAAPLPALARCRATSRTVTSPACCTCSCAG